MVTQGDYPDKSLSRLGFWSAVFTTIWTIWFLIAFAMYFPTLPAEWPGIDAFAASFEPAPYLAWVIPCLLLALTFPVLLSSIHRHLAERQRIWSLLGLIFAVMYGTVLATNYWLLATVVRGSLLSGYTEGLSWFVIGSPHSITNTIEGIGYGFLGFAALFIGLSFLDGRLEQWLRWIFIVNGIAGLAGVALGGLGIEVATIVSLVVWGVTFPIGTILAAMWFRRAD